MPGKRGVEMNRSFVVVVIVLYSKGFQRRFIALVQKQTWGKKGTGGQVEAAPACSLRQCQLPRRRKPAAKRVGGVSCSRGGTV